MKHKEKFVIALVASLALIWGCSSEPEPAKIDLKEDQSELPGVEGELPSDIEKKRQ